MLGFSHALQFADNAVQHSRLVRAQRPQQSLLVPLRPGNDVLQHLLAAPGRDEQLPAAPVAWGLAVDRLGRIIVTLEDGRVLCFGADEGV